MWEMRFTNELARILYLTMHRKDLHFAGNILCIYIITFFFLFVTHVMTIEFASIQFNTNYHRYPCELPVPSLLKKICWFNLKTM